MARFVLSAFADEAGNTIDEQISALVDNGIRFIEPRNVNGKGILTLNDEELSELKEKLDENGIKVNSLGSPIGKYPIEKPLEEHLEDLNKAFHACHVLGTDKIRMFSFFVNQDELEKYRNEVIARLTVMCEMAKKENILLCHENESRIYGQNPEQVKDILTAVPALGGIFDAANYRMNDCDVDNGIDFTLPNLAYLHIKDAIYSEQAIVPAGEGEGKIGEVLDKVDAHTDGVVYLTLEPHLRLFDAYKDIDEHQLKGRYVFKTNRDAFDFAANSLKKLLTENGFREDGNGEWKR